MTSRGRQHHLVLLLMSWVWTLKEMGGNSERAESGVEEGFPHPPAPWQS